MTKLDRSERIRTTGRRAADRAESPSARWECGIASALALVAGGPTGTAVGDETEKDKNAAKAEVAAEAPTYTPTSRSAFNNPKGSTAQAEDHRRAEPDHRSELPRARPSGSSRTCSTPPPPPTIWSGHTRGSEGTAADRRRREDPPWSGSATRSAPTACAQLRDHLFEWLPPPSPSIIHSKIFLFSQVGSANWSRWWARRTRGTTTSSTAGTTCRRSSITRRSTTR